MKRFVLCVALALCAAAILGMTRDPEHWKHRARSMLGGDVDRPMTSYQPRELVQGGNVPPPPRVDPALESLDPQALEQAASYAREHDSRALIVTRHGHIVFERYWHGTGFDSADDSSSFAGTLTALLTGIAIGDRSIGWPDEPVGVLVPEWGQDPRGAVSIRNADSQVLALVLRHATRRRYAEYLSTALWRKLGAADGWLWLDRAGGTAHAECCFVVHQGDWIRVGELLANDGRYQGDEIVRPGWIAQMQAPVKGDSGYRSYLRVGTTQDMSEPYAAKDTFRVDGGGHRLWLVPSMGIVILRTGPAVERGWDESRIANLIIRGAHDYVPPQARPGTDIRTLVPNH